ncbi:uncharacterized protein [Montipora foliosa]|uniref:uncharacterized protein isoform X1 n=2 Tax=Montipora foliosa TaxID=591990 RepID=UPI0035F15466
MLRLKPRLLLLLFLLLCYENLVGCAVREFFESEVESWVVERSSSSPDSLTFYMKPNYTCVYQWCEFKFNAEYLRVADDYSSCTCICKSGFPSFLPSMRRCINATVAASFAGCQQYLNGDTLDTVDLTSEKLNKDQTLKFGRNHKEDETCNLTGSYFHDYDGFQSFWRHVAEPGLFTLEMKGNDYLVEWQPDINGSLSGRIIRLTITCSASTPSTRCFLFKALGSVTYNASSSCSVCPSLPTLPSPVLSSFSSTSLPLAPSRPSLSSPSWPLSPSSPSPSPSRSPSPSPSSLSSLLLPLAKSSIASTPLAQLSSTLAVVISSSTGILLPELTSSYAGTQSKAVIMVSSIDPSWINPPQPSSSTEGTIEPGSQEAQTEKVGIGVLIGAAVGGASFFAAVVMIIILIFRKRRKFPGKSTEEVKKQVGNPVYGISGDEFQMEKPQGHAQQRYQDTPSNGQSNCVAVYSNPDSNYDSYCALYQTLEEQAPGSPVYLSLEKEIPGSPMYQSLNQGQEKPSGTTGLGVKRVGPEQSTSPNPKSSDIRPLTCNSTSKRPIVIPNPNVRGATGSTRPNPYSTGKLCQRPGFPQKPSEVNLHEDGADHGSTSDALYMDLERPKCGQDDGATYVTPTNANCETGFQNPCAEGDQVYTYLKGPEAQNCPESKPETAQEPLYNMLEDPDDEKQSHVGPSGSTYDPLLYNVVDKPESDGSRMPGPNKARPPTGCTNPAYEQTLDFDQSSTSPHGLGIQTESVYEPLT